MAMAPGQSSQAQSVALPKRFPLLVLPGNRDTTTQKDARLVNCYMEKGEDGEVTIRKRPGLFPHSQPSGGAAAGQGIFLWRGSLYSVFGGTLYKDGVSKGGVDATNGIYHFTSCLGSTPKLQLGNGSAAYNYDDSNGLVEITDVDFPATFNKGWAYLDATTYISVPAGQIYGSELNDPVAWDPLNFLTAQIEPDRIISLDKQLVYVICLKEWTTEVFYDAAQPVGSPLGAVQGSKINFGCLSADSVQNIADTLMWLSTTRRGRAQVVRLDQLKPEAVSTRAIERILQPNGIYTTVHSWQCMVDGHSFYGVTSPAGNFTLVYDLVDGAWHQWTDVDGNYWPFVSSATAPFGDGRIIMQHATDGWLYFVDSAYKTDNGVPIVSDIYTPRFGAGTRRPKEMRQLDFVGDMVPGSTLQVRSSDDDYKSWSGWRSVDMGMDRPFLRDEGSFIERAYHLRHTSPTAMGIKALEMQLDVGSG